MCATHCWATHKDWDLEVYQLAPERLRELLDRFGPVNVVGEAFTVYKLGHDLDVSIPRRERKSGRGHRAFVIEGDPAMSIADATRRRDFTINAILQDPLTGELIDPFGGQQDIAARVLRAVSAQTFVEDSLRVLRAAQFAARFEFQIDPETVALCRTMDLSDLPAERVWGELEKLLLRARRPSIGLDWLRKLGAVEKVFPEIQSLIDVPQDPEWHPEGDVFVHTLLVVDRARELIDDLTYARQVTVMLAALAHDFGKPPTTQFLEGRWRSRGHEEAGVEPATRFLDRLNVYTIDGYDVRAQVIALVREHLKPGEFYKKRDEVGEGAFRRLARRCEPDLLYRVAKADSLGRNADWVPREKWYGAEAQEWFAERGSWTSINVRRTRCCWVAICSSWACNLDHAWARSRGQFTRCSWTAACGLSRMRFAKDESWSIRVEVAAVTQWIVPMPQTSGSQLIGTTSIGNTR